MNARRELDELNTRLTREAGMRFDKAILDVKYPQDAPHSEDDVRYHKRKETAQAMSQALTSISDASKTLWSALGLVSNIWAHPDTTKHEA
jgi:hypothetical protein